MANLGNILINLQSMGIVFWAGAVAIALGSTLLVASLTIILRRVKFSRPTLVNPLKRPRLAKTKTSPSPSQTASLATARKTDSGYEPTTFPLQSQVEIATTVSSQIPYELTGRLHRAANTLEEIIHGLHKENDSRGFSPLKDEAESVEYLFKTTVG